MESIPVLIISNEQSLTTFSFTYLMGIQTEQIDNLWGKQGLYEGNWPQNSNEILVGNKYNEIGENKTIQGQNFTVSGRLTPQSSFLDKVIIVDILTLQNLYNYTNKVSVSFLPKESELSHNVTDFENKFPHLDYLTELEQEEIKASMGNFFGDVFSQFRFFAIVTGLLFLFSIEIMNIISRKKDLSIMLILGTSKPRIMGLLWIEMFILTTIGIIIGVPISLFIYFSFFALLQVTAGNNTSFWNAFKIFASDNLNTPTFNLAIKSIGIIFIGGMILAIIPALIVFNLNYLEEIKDKN